jgi:hypothetical protein
MIPSCSAARFARATVKNVVLSVPVSFLAILSVDVC